MFNNTLYEKLQEILRLVEHQKEPLSAIERDLLLEKLRRLYEEVLKMDAPSALPLSPLPPVAEEEPQQDQAPIEPAVIPMEESPIAEQEEPILPPIEIPDWDEMIPLEMPFEEETAPEEQPVEEPVETPEPEEVVEPEPEPEPELEPEVTAEEELAGMHPEPEQESESEPDEVAELEQETEPDPEPEPEVPTLQNSLFDPADIPVSRRSSRRALRSLYGEEPRQAASAVLPSDPQPEVVPEVKAPISVDQQQIVDLVEEPIEEPIEELEAPFVLEELPIEQPEQPMVVGEALQQDHLTIADTIPPTRNVASAILPEGKSLREMISLGDSFLMIKELFYDNKSLYLETLDLLDGMETLDDCLIHIAENYTWNPNSEGVKRLQELLERKFGEN